MYEISFAKIQRQVSHRSGPSPKVRSDGSPGLWGGWWPGPPWLTKAVGHVGKPGH